MIFAITYQVFIKVKPYLWIYYFKSSKRSWYLKIL